MALFFNTGSGLPLAVREPTLAEILSDSTTQAVMKADGIDPPTLEAELRGIAQLHVAQQHRTS